MISILTVNYRSGDDLTKLAESIELHRGRQEVELIITNNSAEEPLFVPAEVFPYAAVVNSDNLGYGRGINLASLRARGDILFLVNPDVRLTAGVLDGAADYMAAHPDVGVLLPRLHDMQGRFQPSARRFYSWPVALYARLPLRGRIPHPAFFRRYLMADDDLSQPLEVDWGLGGAMFLRRADHDPGRIFDERFHLYFEDVDLCMRMWRTGRRVVYHPGLLCEHRHRRQSKRVLSPHGLHHMMSMLRFVRKYGGFPQRPKPADARGGTAS